MASHDPVPHSALDPGLLEIMQCPACGGHLDERTGPHRLVCLACGLAYAVLDGVPQMIVDEAKPESGTTDGGTS